MLLSKILPEVARIHPTNYAMKSKNQAITYDELISQVSSVANGLYELAIKPGDRIALLGNPSPYLAIAECAAVAIGAIPVAIFPSLALIEIQQILKDFNPAAVVYDSDLFNISEIISSLNIEYPILLKSSYDSKSIEDFISKYPSQYPSYEADPDDVVVIIYTGGTTGRSKGVMHSHRNIRNWASMNPKKGVGLNPAKRIVPNQAHLTGQFTLWTTLFDGGCLIYADSFPLQVGEVVAIIEREQINFIGTVGLQFKDIVNWDGIKNKKLQSIEGIACGGAPISEKTFFKALDIFPNVQFTEVYSQTESGNFISFLSINQCLNEGKFHRLQSVGNPANMVLWGQKPFNVRIIDDLGNDVVQGDLGEIICQGDQMMLGYWNNPVETNKVLRNGWLHTGDIGRFDEDGFLYLMDRKKDMVIVNGSNVYCTEVEEVLSKHPSILEIAIIGTPLSEEGEEITAVVILSSDAELTIEIIQQYCCNQIAAFKIPTRLEIINSFPRTSVGKLNKSEIRKLFWSERTRQIN